MVKTGGRRTGGRFVMVGGGINGRFGAGGGVALLGGRLMGELGAGDWGCGDTGGCWEGFWLLGGIWFRPGGIAGVGRDGAGWLLLTEPPVAGLPPVGAAVAEARAVRRAKVIRL